MRLYGNTVTTVVLVLVRKVSVHACVLYIAYIVIDHISNISVACAEPGKGSTSNVFVLHFQFLYEAL